MRYVHGDGRLWSHRPDQVVGMKNITFVLVALVAMRPAFADEPKPTSPEGAGSGAPPDVPATPAAPADPNAPPPEAPPDAPPPEALHEDNEFGPVILIEQIDITGNNSTQTEIIRRALPINAGDVLHASDKRLREARFKVLALGFFR